MYAQVSRLNLIHVESRRRHSKITSSPLSGSQLELLMVVEGNKDIIIGALQSVKQLTSIISDVTVVKNKESLAASIINMNYNSCIAVIFLYCCYIPVLLLYSCIAVIFLYCCYIPVLLLYSCIAVIFLYCCYIPVLLLYSCIAVIFLYCCYIPA